MNRLYAIFILAAMPGRARHLRPPGSLFDVLSVNLPGKAGEITGKRSLEKIQNPFASLGSGMF